MLVCSYWGAWVGGGEWREAGGACGAKRKKGGEGGRGGDTPKARASDFCTPPFNKLLLSECL